MPLVPIPYVHVGIGALLTIVSLPLCFKLVPKNNFYGIRIPKAFISDANWYAINCFGGVVLTLGGLFLMLFGYLTWDSAPSPNDPMAVIDMVAPLPVLALAIVIILVYARTLPEK
jgi:uncharacterized membrane protein